MLYEFIYMRYLEELELGIEVVWFLGFEKRGEMSI